MQIYRQTFQFEAEDDAAAIRIAQRAEEEINADINSPIMHVVSLAKQDFYFTEVDLTVKS